MILSAPSFFKVNLSKKGQVLMLGLWILAILTVLAVSIGHRVSLALRLSRYQVEKLQALSFAKAGINQAVVLLEGDSNSFDALNEPWVNNEGYFKNILSEEDSDGLAQVSYTVVENDRKNTIFGVVDEERKININTAPRGLLVELFSRAGVDNPLLIADEVCAWRGDAAVAAPDYRDLGYSNKGAEFSNPQELVLVKDIDREAYVKFKDYLTVWGDGRVNLNTADSEILETLVDYAKKSLGPAENDPEDLIARIIKLRLEDPSSSFSDLLTKLRAREELTPGQTNILNRLQGLLTFKSTCFYASSNGKIKRSNLTFGIQCVFDRVNKKMVYWHED